MGSLANQPSAAELFGDEVLDGHLVVGQQVVDAAAGAELLRAGDERVKCLLVTFQQRHTDGDFGLVGVLAVDELEIALEIGFEFFLRKNLNHEAIDLVRHEVAQRLFVARLVHQVAEQYDDPASRVAEAKVFDAFGQCGRFLDRLDRLDVLEHSPHALPSAQDRSTLADALVDGFDTHTVSTNQPDKAERGGELFGVFEFRRSAEVHRHARVDQRVKVQIFFFEKQLDDQLVEAGVEVPIEQTQVVAGDVVTKVGELDALAFALATPFALHSATKDLARDKFQSLELSEQLGGQQFGFASSAHACSVFLHVVFYYGVTEDAERWLRNERNIKTPCSL